MSNTIVSAGQRDQAVTLHGRLHVGEVRENGYLVGIYTMDGDKITGPLDL